MAKLLIIYALGYAFTFKKVFIFIYKYERKMGQLDTFELAMILTMSGIITLLWPFVWIGVIVNSHILQPLIHELERRRDA
jgi:hypothetical protein